MSVILNVISTPSAWNSAHQPVEYVLGFEEQTLQAVIDISGKASFRTPDFTNNTPLSGERIYVESGIYQGYHTIVSIGLGVGVQEFLTDTDYISNDSGIDVKHIIDVPEFKLYKGYTSGWDDELPFELVATFTPVISPEVDIRFDVSGFLKSIFTIQPPTIGIDFSLFNRFLVRYDNHGMGNGSIFFYDLAFQVLNSSIPTAELNSVYLGTGVYLSSSTTQIIFGCGKTILSLLDATGVVINTDVENGDTGSDYFYNDYSSTDYLTQIST